MDASPCRGEGAASSAARGWTEVPAALLERPHADELRNIDRDLAALEIDRYLRQLARQEAACRRVLGRLALAFLARLGHHRLGFARLGDYTRERLGICARELQTAARLERALEGLPLIRAAFAAGDLSWTQVRLLAPRVSAETESAWLALARGRTVRALEALLRDFGGGRAETDAAIAGDAATDIDDDAEASIDGEPEVRFHLRCPRRVRAQWRVTVELARRVAGEQSTIWQAAEAIAAEGLAAGCPSSGFRSGASPIDAMAGRAAADHPSPAPSVSPGVGEPAGEADDSRHDCTRTYMLHQGETDAGGVELDWSAVVAAIPEDVVALGRDLDQLDAFGLDARLRALLRASRQVDWQVGRLLRLFLDLRLHTALGFPSGSRYLRERMGMSVRKARALIAIERKTWQASAFGEAYRSGRLPWVRALTLLPVVGEMAAEAWVERASAVTVRRLAAEVEWALDVRDAGPSCVPLAPPPLGASLGAPEVQMRAPTGWDFLDATIEFCGPASVVALLRSAIAAFEEPVEPAWKALERLLEHARAEWERLLRHRDPIFARDGWRCAVPACSSRRNLHDHHVRFRSSGGDNSRANRVSVCAWHHLHGIHAGRVRAHGLAPDEMQWEIGLRPDHPPLMLLVGESYVEERSM